MAQVVQGVPNSNAAEVRSRDLIGLGATLGIFSELRRSPTFVTLWTDQDSIELYHYINDPYINDPSEMSSLHESPRHTAILAGFRRLSDSLAALCSRARARPLTLSSESDDDH